MGRYRAIEPVTWQDDSGHTNRLGKGESTDDPLVVAHAPEAFEDTSKDNELGEGTSAAEQKGLKPEGASTIEQGELNQELKGAGSGGRGLGTSAFASSYLPDSEGTVTTSGAEVGSKEHLEDVEQFRQFSEDHEAAEAERNEALVQERSAAIAGSNGDVQPAETPAEEPAPPTAKPAPKVVTRKADG